MEHRRPVPRRIGYPAGVPENVLDNLLGAMKAGDSGE